MKSSKAILILLTVLLLVSASAAWAAQAGKPAPKTSTAPAKPAPKKEMEGGRSMTGTVSSMTATSLVLSRMVKGKAVETTFVLTPQTEREVTPAVGDKVSVHYRVKNKEKIATEIEPVHPRGGEAAEKKHEAAPAPKKPGTKAKP